MDKFGLIYVTNVNALTQPAHLNILQWTADGPITARALELVVTGLSPELAATLHLRMAARLALGMRPNFATHKHVQVYLVGNNWELTVVVK